MSMQVEYTFNILHLIPKTGLWKYGVRNAGHSVLGYTLKVVLTLEAPGTLGARRASKSGWVQAGPDQGVGQQLLALCHLVH